MTRRPPPQQPPRPRAFLSVVAISLSLLCIPLGLASFAARGWAAGADAGEEARLREAARLRGLSLAAMEEGNYGRAEEHLLSVAEILPDNILPPLNLAICYLKLHRIDEAMAQISRARKIDPDNSGMLYTLALLLEGQPGLEEEWSRVLGRFASAHPGDPRPWWLRGRRALDHGDFDEAGAHLARAVRLAPDNLVLLVDSLVAAAEAADVDGASDALDAVEDRLNGFEGSQEEFADRIRDLVDLDDAAGMRPPALVLQNLLRPTELYRISLIPLTGGQTAEGQLFPQLDFDPPLPKSIQGGQDIELAFVEAGKQSGLDGLAAGSSSWFLHRGERDVLMRPTPGGLERVAWSGDRFAATAVDLDRPPGEINLIHDVDQDGIADLVTADRSFGVRLHPGSGDGSFASGRVVISLGEPHEILTVAPLDLDHEGDLDLFVGRRGAPDLFLQNNGDGTWSERGAELALDGGPLDTPDLASADIDDDGDLDLLIVHSDAAPRLLLNRRAGPFEDASGSWGLTATEGSFRAVRIADFDLDGALDLLLWGDRAALLLNRQGRFEPAELPALPEAAWGEAEVADFDNDGDPDILVFPVGPGDGLLLRNRRPELGVEEAPRLPDAGAAPLVADLDEDGDLDAAVILADGRLGLWRNEGGNANNWVRLRLLGKNDNNSKNNTEGLFARIEARVGSTIQTLIGNGGLNHLGLGASRQAEVIRVVWTNGLSQSWLQVSANRTLVEEQVLKGSCPFLYAWDGRQFRFVTDLMWRSPLGMLLADGSPAPHQPARDYVLIPGEALAPSGGELWLQVTEELWETAFVDRQQLVAVDHPAELQLVVDEKLAPPPYPETAPLHWLAEPIPPVAARDQLGRDVLAEILARDGRHVGGLPLDRYQGLTRGHHLELAFPEVPTARRLRLFLWGWTFPTDTSINLALAQDSGRQARPPRLEILQPDGTWRSLPVFVGFPNGKRKAVVVELPRDLPSAPLTLRLATTMQIYWDAAALAVGDPHPVTVTTPLEPLAADLHYRGYSQLFRESDTGPHLFDYRRVTVEPRFRDMEGAFTRFGEVGELLLGADNRYVVMNAGDELTVRYDASSLPDLPDGWRRDWVLFTDGWVKDGDLNTAFSRTVEPLPYRGMTAYPDQPRHRYPDDPEHLDYLRRYQTRRVTDRPFREAIRPGVD